MNNSELVSLIMEKYPNFEKDFLEGKIESLTGVVRMGVEDFLVNGNSLKVDILGYTVESLEKEKNLDVINAYFTIDWIIRDPESAIETLKKGFDKVGL